MMEDEFDFILAKALDEYEQRTLTNGTTTVVVSDDDDDDLMIDVWKLEMILANESRSIGNKLN